MILFGVNDDSSPEPPLRKASSLLFCSQNIACCGEEVRSRRVLDDPVAIKPWLPERDIKPLSKSHDRL